MRNTPAQPLTGQRVIKVRGTEWRYTDSICQVLVFEYGRATNTEEIFMYSKDKPDVI